MIIIKYIKYIKIYICVLFSLLIKTTQDMLVILFVVFSFKESQSFINQ